MSASSAPTQLRQSSDQNTDFLKLLPAVETHASISFRHLPETDREEAIAEATAAAFVNFDSARRKGNPTAACCNWPPPTVRSNR